MSNPRVLVFLKLKIPGFTWLCFRQISENHPGDAPLRIQKILPLEYFRLHLEVSYKFFEIMFPV